MWDNGGGGGAGGGGVVPPYFKTVPLNKAVSISVEDTEFLFLKIPKGNNNNYNKDIFFSWDTPYMLWDYLILIVCVCV